MHETVQVVGAGQIYTDIFLQPIALDEATITKLVRNVYMAVVIPLMALYYGRKAQGGNFKEDKTSFTKLFPVFIFGFLTMATYARSAMQGSMRAVRHLAFLRRRFGLM